MKLSSVIGGKAAAASGLIGSNVRYSGGQGDQAQRKTDKDKEPEGNGAVIRIKQQTPEDMIADLQKQISRIRANDKYDDATKKHKIEALTEKMQALEEADRKQKMQETKKSLENNRSDQENKLREKAKQRKKELEERLGKNDAVDVGFSDESFKSLVKAEMELGKTANQRILKAQKEMELTRTKQDARFDAELAESMASSTRDAAAGILADQMNDKVIDEFIEKYGSINEFIEGLEGADREKAIALYTKEMIRFVSDKINGVINSDEFISQFQLSASQKDALMEELNDILSNIESEIIRSLAKANKEAQGAGQDAAGDSASDTTAASDSIASGIVANVVAKISADLTTS